MTSAAKTQLPLLMATSFARDNFSDAQDPETRVLAIGQDQIAATDLPHDDSTEDGDSEASGDLESESGFRRKVQLPEFSFARRNVAQLMVLLNDSKYLDIEPAYQRDVVWPRKRMSGLIDSLLQNFYVPPVLFNVTRVKIEDGTIRYKRTCVDGKQRLSSIRAFMHGKLPCHDHRGNPWFYCIEKDADGNPLKKYMKNILPNSIKEEFDKKDILCCEYLDLTEIQEREIFQRVQLGIPLTAAEKVRATTGVWQEFAQLFEQDFPCVVALTTNKRASGFRRILQCFSQIYETQDPTSADGVPRLKHSSGALERFCKLGHSLSAKTKAHLRSVFDLFDRLVVTYPDVFGDNGYTRNKSFSPMELVSVSVLLSLHADRGKVMLRGDILALRDHLRLKHFDLRMHDRVWKTAWDYIDNIERYRGTTDGSTTAISSRRTEPISSLRAKPRYLLLDRRNSLVASGDGAVFRPATSPTRGVAGVAQTSSDSMEPPNLSPAQVQANGGAPQNTSSEESKRPNPLGLSLRNAIAPMAPMSMAETARTERKRTLLDLNSSSNARSALAVKRARLTIR